MKKRLVSLLLTMALVLTLAPAAFALDTFPDITDTETAQNAEVLRLMGVMEGDNKGRFNPDSSLTRAQFCKMTVVLTGKRSVVSRYSNYTVFPDVRATTWAAGYVNYAANHEVGLIHGMPDGTFAPSRAITYGEAVAILTRLLGYTDKDTGGIWPDGYIALATEAGMTKGLSIGGNDAITRAQAAKLFVNALSSKNEAGETMLSRLGYTKSEKETTLYSVDLANNQLRTEAGNVDLAEPKNSTALNGLKGYVLTNADGKAVTFLPSTGATTGTAVSDAAIIVGADGSTAGFDVLTGGSANYSLYRNGVPAAASELKKDDVVIYNAATNAVLACDTRVAVYYENCAPSPADPESIKVLGGTELKVMPTARQSVAQFKPGQNMVILLAADGRVAGARESGGRTNAYAYVDAEGKVSLLYGNSMKTIAEDPSESLKMDTSKVLGLVVRISQSGSRYNSTIHLSVQRGASGNLDPVKRSLGSKLIADGVLVFSGNKLTTFESLGKTVIPSDSIAYARTNAKDEVDLIVIK
ncbi:MAG: S-layer homology domain-containing protein, partial [Oscillospiraceae bacterium]|nr:S-layer homology domain-containing protein [Oscillospiraceae bacterium]